MSYHLGIEIGSIFVPPIGRRLVASSLVSIGVPQGDQFLCNDTRVSTPAEKHPFHAPHKTATEGAVDEKVHRGIDNGKQFTDSGEFKNDSVCKYISQWLAMSWNNIYHSENKLWCLTKYENQDNDYKCEWSISIIRAIWVSTNWCPYPTYGFLNNPNHAVIQKYKQGQWTNVE